MLNRLLLIFILSVFAYQPFAQTGMVVSFEQFGAKGNGKVDDTKAIQAAINSGAKELRGKKGAIYLVTKQGFLSENGNTYPYCLLLKSNCIINLQQSTIVLGDQQTASVFINNFTLPELVTTNFTLCNGVINGNRTKQGLHKQGEIALVYLKHCTNIRLANLKLVEARQYGARLLNMDQSNFTQLSCIGSDGDGFIFGTTADRNTIRNSFIDAIYAANCSNNYKYTDNETIGHQGNGVVFTTEYCKVGRVEVYNCSGSLKIQDTSHHTSFKKLIAGGDGKTKALGVKIQANGPAGLIPHQITVDSIEARNCSSEGLVVYLAKQVTIQYYKGEKNGWLVNRDTDLRGDSTIIAKMEIVNPYQHGLVINTEANNYFIKKVYIENAPGTNVQITALGEGTIDVLQVKEGPKPSQLIFNVTETSASGKLNLLLCNRVNVPGSYPILITGGNYKYRIGSIKATTKSKTEFILNTGKKMGYNMKLPSITAVYVGGNSDYFQPVLEITDSKTGKRIIDNKFKPNEFKQPAGITATVKPISVNSSYKIKVLEWRVFPRIMEW
jgi:hypothetical protein